MLGIHGAWDLVIPPNIDTLPPTAFITLGWVSEDRDFVALATVSRATLRLSGGLAALSEYREYYQRIAQRRAQEERDYQEEQDELDLAVWMVAEEPQSEEAQSE